MDDIACFHPAQAPNAGRPLLGMTILAVEDSLYASDALRLMCLHSGARIRRADCLRSARRHLRVYRPSVVVVDLGLPDGSGADLIADLTAATPRIPVILGTSGDDFAEDLSVAAGADGFLRKPITSLVRFQEVILSLLPAERQPLGRGRSPRSRWCRTGSPIRTTWRISPASSATTATSGRWIMSASFSAAWRASPMTRRWAMPPTG